MPSIAASKPAPSDPTRSIVLSFLFTFEAAIELFVRLGLVDTGSDFTLLPSGLAEALGTALSSGTPTSISGVDGEEFAALSGTVELELRRRGSSLRWQTPVYFADQEYVLLGNQGFLEFFVATFDWAKRVLTLVANERIRRR